MQVKEPASPKTKAAPRVKAPRYYFVFEEEPNINDIVLSLSNGLNAEYVDPKIYAYIFQPLKAARNNLIEAGNLHAARTTENAIQFINDYYYKEKQKELIAQERVAQAEFENQLAIEEEIAQNPGYTQEEIEENVDYAMSGQFEQIFPKIHKLLVRELRERRAEKIDEHDYIGAEKYETTARKVLALDSDTRYNEITTTRVTDLSDKLDIAQEEIKQLHYTWKHKIKDAKKKKEAEIEELRERNAIDLDSFDENFEKDPPLKYQKHSVKYLQIRKQERALAVSKRYQESIKFKAEADQLDLEEQEQWRVQWKHDLELARKDLIKKQEEKVYVVEQNHNLLIAQLVRDYKRELDHATKALSHLETHYEQAEMLASISPNGTLTKTRGVKSSKKKCRSRSSRPKTARCVRPKNLLPPLNAEQLEKENNFRQRRAINSIVYTRTVVVRGKTAPKTSRV